MTNAIKNQSDTLLNQMTPDDRADALKLYEQIREDGTMEVNLSNLILNGISEEDAPIVLGRLLQLHIRNLYENNLDEVMKCFWVDRTD